MYFECRKCDRKFDELNREGKVKFCGDHWICLDCNHDITKDAASLYKEAMELADVIWNSNMAEADDGEYFEHRATALKERNVGEPVNVTKVRFDSVPPDFDIDPSKNQYQ